MIKTLMRKIFFIYLILVWLASLLKTPPAVECSMNLSIKFLKKMNDEKKQLSKMTEIKGIIRISLIIFFSLFCLSLHTANTAFAQDEPQRVGLSEEVAPKFMPYHYLHQQPEPPPEEFRYLSSGRVDTKAVTKSRQKSIRALAPGMKEYIELDNLVVIYTNTEQDTITQDRIDILKQEIAEVKEFFWRNSHLTVDMEVTYLIINRYLSLNQFYKYEGNQYWLTLWKVDLTHSVTQDLIDSGVSDYEYDNIWVFFAWKNTENAVTKYRAAALGVHCMDWLGDTGYMAMPLLSSNPDFEDKIIIHENLHLIDHIYEMSGDNSFPDPDISALYPDYIDDGVTDVNALFIKNWPTSKWFNMYWPWGNVCTVLDSDDDGIPDDSNKLAITEASFSSNPFQKDTDGDGLDDLQEATAGFYRGSHPNNPDTDNDLKLDNVDKYPFDPIDENRIKKSPTIDGVIDSGEWVLFDSMQHSDPYDLSARTYLNWNDGYLYFAVNVLDDMIKTPSDEPWLDDSIQLNIDASNDGFFYGSDNYCIVVAPREMSGGNATVKAFIVTNGKEDDDLLPDSEIFAKYSINGTYYTIEIAIPSNTQLGLDVKEGLTFGIQTFIVDYDINPGRSKYDLFIGGTCEKEKPRFLDVTLLSNEVTPYMGKTLYVDGTVGEDSNNGLNWGDAKSTIQAGINEAMDKDTVLVKYGVYNIINTIDYFGKNIKLASDDGTHKTYETATKDASCCFIDANSGGCQVFYFHYGETSEAVLMGFTIENGIGTNGGGIHCRNSSPTITHCIINKNSAGYGSGIFCGNSSPTIINCTISNNFTSYNTDNTGGGIACYNASPNILNCTINKNKTCFGGGIYCYNNSSPNIINCIIKENQAMDYGGGIRCFESSPTITNCTIIQNAANYGGGIACQSSSPEFIHCTISGNTANYFGGGMYCYSASPAITNSILWGNLPNEIGGSTVIITYSNILGGYGDPTIAHNINAEPLFIDQNAGDYRLWFTSPCIDAGDPNAPKLPSTDKAGNPRIINGKPDMGACEYMELLTLHPGLNLVSFPQGLEWDYLMDHNAPIVKIQAYQPETLSWLTLAPSEQEGFSFSLVRGWLAYVSPDKPDTIDLTFPFISSTSGFNPAEDLLPGMNLLTFYSLYEMLTIQYSQQLIWPKNVFQKLNQKTSKDPLCIAGYERSEGKWQAAYPFFGRSAGFTTKLKKEGYVAYFK